MFNFGLIFWGVLRRGTKSYEQISYVDCLETIFFFMGLFILKILTYI